MQRGVLTDAGVYKNDHLLIATGGRFIRKLPGIEHALVPCEGISVAEEIDRHRPDLVLLAGFMRVLTDAFVRRYPGRMINVHPALLPAFPGLDTHRRALAAGVKLHGCTVHFVTPEVDVGPIIVQAAVPVLPDDTEASLAARVLEQEHRIYAQAVRWWAEGRLSLHENGTVRVSGTGNPTTALISPPPDAR